LKNHKAKATSKTSANLTSYAKIRIYIQDHNEYMPQFENPFYTVVLNEPEQYIIGNVIMIVKAVDKDGDDSGNDLTYQVLGSHQERYGISYCFQLLLAYTFFV
jgi:hypothetical protein